MYIEELNPAVFLSVHNAIRHSVSLPRCHSALSFVQAGGNSWLEFMEESGDDQMRCVVSFVLSLHWIYHSTVDCLLKAEYDVRGHYLCSIMVYYINIPVSCGGASEGYIINFFPPPSVFDGTSSIESKRSTKALPKKAIICQNRPGSRHCSCMRSIEEGYETEEKAKVVAAV